MYLFSLKTITNVAYFASSLRSLCSHCSHFWILWKNDFGQLLHTPFDFINLNFDRKNHTKSLLATLVKVKKIGNLLLVFSTTMEENVALASRKKLRDNNLFLLLLRLLSTFLKENVPNGKWAFGTSLEFQFTYSKMHRGKTFTATRTFRWTKDINNDGF